MAGIDISGMTLAAMRRRADDMTDAVLHTPAVPLNSAMVTKVLGGGSVHLKLECFQHTGTFKARGALSVARSIATNR